MAEEEYEFDEGDMCEIPDLADTSDFDNQFQELDVGKSSNNQHTQNHADSGSIRENLFGAPSTSHEYGSSKASSFSPPANQYSPPTSSYGGSSYPSSSSAAQSSGFVPKKSPTPSPATNSRFGGGGDKCPRCDKTVYFAEAREGPNNVKFHKACFSCVTCRKTLSDSTFSERQGEIYCKVCYARDFGPKGFGFGGLSTEGPATPPTDGAKPPSPPFAKPQGGTSPTAPSPKDPAGAQKKTPPGRFGGGDTCVRCQKTVYFAEAREGPNNNKYHKSCFACITCQKVLDSTFAERQGEVYCKPCYAKEFGPKGFGFGGTMT